VGVDTHVRKHVYTILAANTGEKIDTRDFPTTTAGINREISWVARRTEADADTLWIIEGTATYGAILTGTVASNGYPVAEAPRMDAKQHYGTGKSDALDASASPQQPCHYRLRNCAGHGSTTRSAKPSRPW